MDEVHYVVMVDIKRVTNIPMKMEYSKVTDPGRRDVADIVHVVMKGKSLDDAIERAVRILEIQVVAE